MGWDLPKWKRCLTQHNFFLFCPLLRFAEFSLFPDIFLQEEEVVWSLN